MNISRAGVVLGLHHTRPRHSSCSPSRCWIPAAAALLSFPLRWRRS